jgi:hypothetical protein
MLASRSAWSLVTSATFPTPPGPATAMALRPPPHPRTIARDQHAVSTVAQIVLTRAVKNRGHRGGTAGLKW